ncbi:quinone oxidoreductase family protein [Mucilaginibacter ginsenosidivorax]|uniref:Quinone oxidoreductase n=1 Tax=Mucilaginibacter ginsenosidivorax TaxID=862126 RepID=A0A5B8W5N7_9SPHI|nr:quinone oxidoreductase [Mucilaginibacter ginsenosidivorax]QEC78899.1 quinone oxidoreductase [Mucilaginibacter ginsenosidivorax]
MKALTFSNFGDPGVLQYLEIAPPVLKAGEILVEMKAIGLNFSDTERRKGNYHLLGKPPYIAGYEGAGIVADNNGLPGFKPGDRVSFGDVPFANAELVAVPVTHAIPLPAEISFDTAAAILLQGMTAHYLATDSYPVKPGETVLLHAVAGGVGQLLTQICKLLGAKVIGLTSSEAKRTTALAAGADTVFLYQDDWKRQVLEYTGGKGVHVTYDSVAKTLNDSLEVTRTLGTVVLYGKAGGLPEPPPSLELLMDRSQTITGGDLWSYLDSKEERIKRSGVLFKWISSGQLVLQTPKAFKLADGKLAHEYMESKQSTGKIILIP